MLDTSSVHAAAPGSGAGRPLPATLSSASQWACWAGRGRAAGPAVGTRPHQETVSSRCGTYVKRLQAIHTLKSSTLTQKGTFLNKCTQKRLGSFFLL